MHGAGSDKNRASYNGHGCPTPGTRPSLAAAPQGTMYRQSLQGDDGGGGLGAEQRALQLKE